MPTDAYAKSVVDKLMQRHVNCEIWQGNLAWFLRILLSLLPLRLLVSEHIHDDKELN
jgi:1-acylglycerone phosphate reductase